jgi:hypothetical protein
VSTKRGQAQTRDAAAAASLSVAAAKALAQEFAVEIASGVFELAGASATDREYALDRHWRNVRIHSLHDPARWKYVHLGNYTLHGTKPPQLGVLIGQDNPPSPERLSSTSAQHLYGKKPEASRCLSDARLFSSCGPVWEIVQM